MENASGFNDRNSPGHPENPRVSPPDTEVSVSFGEGSDLSMPVSWASRMLTILHDEDPGRFGKLLTRAVTES